MVTTTQAAKTTKKPPSRNEDEESSVPVGLIAALILLCVLIAALIFLWVKYREHKRKLQERVLERMLRRNQGDSESNGQATTPDTGRDPGKSESQNLLYSSSADGNLAEATLPSPNADANDVFDEMAERRNSLEPIVEDDDPEVRLNAVGNQHPREGQQPREGQHQREEPVAVVDEDEVEPSPEPIQRRYDSGYHSQSYRNFRRYNYPRHCYNQQRHHDENNREDAEEEAYTITKINV